MFGLTIASQKLRLVVFGHAGGTLGETIIIHTGRWVSQTLPLCYSGIVQILGFHFELNGSHTYQFQITKQRIAIACAAMATAVRTAPAGIVSAVTLSVLARACYAGQCSHWSVQELELLGRPINALFRRMAKFLPPTASIPRSFPRWHGLSPIN